VILGIDYLTKYDGVISCAKRMITLTSLQGERVEVNVSMPAEAEAMVNQLEEKSLENIRIVCEYPDVFLEELPGMPPDRDVEFSIELLPRTALISKKPYRMDVKDLVELKKQIDELLEIVLSAQARLLGEPSSICEQERWFEKNVCRL
jgi:hypothetical protein